MNFKKLLLFVLISLQFPNLVMAADSAVSYKLYGFVRSDLYFNSRKNFEALDGLFNIYPLPQDMSGSKDKNAVPNSEMLAISTRLGLDLTGGTILNAKTSAKIECDFAGISSSYYLIRLRQAYMKFNWSKSELMIGQAWHPMFGAIQPVTPALSVGTPFQSFNRSPQIRFKQNLNDKLSFTAATVYQMQYMNQGPSGATVSYMKNGLLPSAYLGLDLKSTNFLCGVGVDGKSLKIGEIRLNSGAAVAYARYSNKKFQISAKSTLGQNMSELLTPGGYGLSSVDASNNPTDYSNINTSTSWLSVSYGAKWQVGVYGGYLKNLGSVNDFASVSGKYTYYGYGAFSASQIQMDQLYRIAPHVSYNVANFKLACEYELTTANYGTMKADGKVENPYNVSNHRVCASVSYSF